MEEEEEQEVWSWGAGTEGQLGIGSEKDELLFWLVSSLSSVYVSALSCGGVHVIALTSGGKVFSWERGSSGQLGQGRLSHSLSQAHPYPLPRIYSHCLYFHWLEPLGFYIPCRMSLHLWRWIFWSSSAW